MKNRAGLKLIVGALARLAGGRAEVVLPLARAMDRAAKGQNELQRQKSTRKQVMSAEGLRIIMLVVTALASILLSLTMLIKPADVHPPLGVIILVAAHWLLVLNMVVSQAGPALLVDEDHKVIGAWPLTRREVLLARLGTVLRPAFEVSLAATTAPLVVYLVVGRPFVLPALALALGLIIQTIGVAFGVTAVLMALVRLLGRRRAERLATLLADGNFPMFGFLLLMFMDRIIAYVQAHPKVLLAAPPAWFAAWGDLAAGRLYWAMAALGLVTSLALVFVALRLLSPSGHAADTTPVAGRPSRWSPAHLIAGALSPMMRSREGWVVRRLLEAHLRDDWRFVAGMVVFPLMMIFMFFSRGVSDLDPDDVERLSVTALTAVPFTHMLLLLAATLIFTMSFSSQPQALWLVALGDLDVRRIMAAQRALIRGLVTVPVVIIYGVRAWGMGAPPQVVLIDATLLLVQVETIVLILQPFIKTMPFSQAISRDHGAGRFGLFLLLGLVSLVFVILNLIYAQWHLVRLITWITLPFLWFAAHHWSQARLATTRLHMDAVRGS